MISYILRVRLNKLFYDRLLFLCKVRNFNKSALIRELIFEEWLRYKNIT